MIDKKVMTMDEYQKYLKDLAKLTKHTWMKDDDGEIDYFAMSEEFHNGPMCEKCHYSYCQHCNVPKNECPS